MLAFIQQFCVIIFFDGVFIGALSASMPLVFGAFSDPWCFQCINAASAFIDFLILGAFGASMCFVPCVHHVPVMLSCVYMCVCCFCFLVGAFMCVLFLLCLY